MEINKYIDHTNLNVTASKEDIKKLCEEAIKYRFASVIVSPYYVSLAKELLEGTNIEIGTVIGFPFGYNTTATKEYEAIVAIEDGATEIDMVVNLQAVKNQDFEYVKKEIEDIRDAIDGKTLKVIIETCYLNETEIMELTKICNNTFVNYIKTSTGFGTRGASVEDINIINKYKNEVLEVKASGGIRTKDDIIKYIELGVTRIGTSAGAKIMEDDGNETV